MQNKNVISIFPPLKLVVSQPALKDAATRMREYGGGVHRSRDNENNSFARKTPANSGNGIGMNFAKPLKFPMRKRRKT